MTTVAIHQPDLLPYSGFWYKMIHSDVFILAVHDQFQKHGYQRRVTMRGRWASHILEGKPALIPIEDVVVREGWQRHLTNVIRGRYSAARYFKTRGRELCERIEAAQGRSLDEVNTAMIEIVRDMLGITTPLVTTPPPQGHNVARLIEQVSMVDGDVYLSGSGGLAYMGPDAPQVFREHGIELTWSRHEHLTGDSVVTLLLDEEDPMPAIIHEHEG